jgi:hypothetical protein
VTRPSTDGAERAYLALAAVGLAGTAWFNLRSGGVEGGYLKGWFANAAASSAAVDLIVVAAAASMFMIVEGRRLGMRRPWLYPLLALVTAIAFTFPLFLYARSRTMRRATTM